jgi:hypothetical protein
LVFRTDNLLAGKSDSPCFKQDQTAVFDVQRRQALLWKTFLAKANAIPG